jgi:hypothetical protein
VRSNPGYQWKRDGRAIWIDVAVDGVGVLEARVEPVPHASTLPWCWSIITPDGRVIELGRTPTRRAGKVFALSATCRALRESLRRAEKSFFAVQPEEESC